VCKSHSEFAEHEFSQVTAEVRKRVELGPKLRRSRVSPARASTTDATRRALLGASAALSLAALTAVEPAHAQAISGEFSVQRFDPAPGPRNYFSTRGVRTDGTMVWSAGLVANYSYLPFVVRSCISLTDCNDPNANRPTETKVIENMITGNALVSLTPMPRLQLGLSMPVTWAKGQGIDSQGLSSKGGINAVGAGDATLEGKFRLHGEVKDPFVVGLGGFVTAPLGHLTAKGAYIGDTLPSAGLRAIFDGEQGPVSFGANLAGVFRDKGVVGTTAVGSEARYSVAGGYRVGPVVRLILDFFGTTRFSAQRGENTLELDGGAQFVPLGSPVTITLGGGSGLVEGVGVPRVRVFAGVLYALEKRDRDGDGIDDASDQCPTLAEDKDGYEDADGCPDPDNDNDGIPDAQDKCPNQPEDQDGFEDRDGCPDPDNDHDGIPDVSDQCPNQPETKNGFKDEDGCPDEADRDNDGVPDSRDKCPDEPEDTDGFQDTDGCPDLDNDNDGIPDAQDECIDEPETKNGFQDADGCPDDPGKATVKKKK
jgi:OOP family OmpA-OmpF porin